MKEEDTHQNRHLCSKPVCGKKDPKDVKGLHLISLYALIKHSVEAEETNIFALGLHLCLLYAVCCITL